MASRLAPRTGGRRPTMETIKRELIDDQYGTIRMYGPCPHTYRPRQISTGGSSMTALLGPDLGDAQRRGSQTTNLEPVVSLLNQYSAKTWIAGHLLNADLGGSGTNGDNLTPLTSKANSNHSTFEKHIKRMLNHCNQLDRADPSVNDWYGILYTVTVSPVRYLSVPNPADMHSYAYSHITLNYEFVKLPKFPAFQPPAPGLTAPNTPGPVPSNDPHMGQLQAVVVPVFAASVSIVNWTPAASGISFGVEVHNEP